MWSLRPNRILILLRKISRNPERRKLSPHESYDIMERILYVSDLDGTLLRPNETISSQTCDIMNRLIGEGMTFSYATARSSVTSKKVTEGLQAAFPIIVHNGVFIVDNRTGKRLRANLFTDEQKADIFSVLEQFSIAPLVYSLLSGEEKFSYVTNMLSRSALEFLPSRKDDPRSHPVSEAGRLREGQAYYFTCLDREEKLLPAYEQLKGRYYCTYQMDIYTGEPWLEIMPPTASKANAVLQLKDLLCCDKVVAFGDAVNDVTMFQIADECYAVGNACEELKQIATGIIGRNEQDGVAKWLLENARFPGRR